MSEETTVEALEPAVLEALQRYDTPKMANAIGTFDIRPRDTGFAGHEIRCILPDLPAS